MKDSVRILAEWAEVTGTTLNTLIGSNVMRDRLISSFKNTVKAILIFRGATGTEYKPDIENGRFYVSCFGGSDDMRDAEEVYRAVVERFHDKSGDTTTGGIVVCELETASPMWDPEEGWPSMVCIFRVLTK